MGRKTCGFDALRRGKEKMKGFVGKLKVCLPIDGGVAAGDGTERQGGLDSWRCGESRWCLLYLPSRAVWGLAEFSTSPPGRLHVLTV